MDHSGFSPPESHNFTATMESDISGVSVNQISAPAAVFQVVDEHREAQVSSRSTTLGRTPIHTHEIFNTPGAEYQHLYRSTQPANDASTSFSCDATTTKQHSELCSASA